jgi:hypothetical protein
VEGVVTVDTATLKINKSVVASESPSKPKPMPMIPSEKKQKPYDL